MHSSQETLGATHFQSALLLGVPISRYSLRSLSKHLTEDRQHICLERFAQPAQLSYQSRLINRPKLV